MKELKATLILTYIILIILLLLGFIKCEGVSNPVIDDKEDTSIPEEPKPIIKESFSADVVMCIDCSGSMGELINTIKNNAVNFYPDLKKAAEKHGKEIKSMRIKVVAFKCATDRIPLEESPFYNIPSHDSDFRTFVSSLRADGSGLSGTEVGYDAIGLAMKSGISTDSDHRCVVILWTDDESETPSSRRSGFSSYSELEEMWNVQMKDVDRKLILFTSPSRPNSWEKIENSWENTKLYNIGGRLSEMDYDEILMMLSESI